MWSGSERMNRDDLTTHREERHRNCTPKTLAGNRGWKSNIRKSSLLNGVAGPLLVLESFLSTARIVFADHGLKLLSLGICQLLADARPSLVTNRFKLRLDGFVQSRELLMRLVQNDLQLCSLLGG